ncbi:MAG: efflux RND transporter periplasmic adaptor subunit [Planctomycetota bacterium]
MRILHTAVLVLVLGSLAIGQGAQPASVKLDPVRAQVVREQVTGVATVEPWLRTTLSAEIAGLVADFPLREGDVVEKGKTTVCELKRTTLLIDLAEAEALLARAEATSDTAAETALATLEELAALMDQAERERVRAEELLEKQVITQSEYDRTTAEATAAKSRHARAKKNYELARKGADPEAKAREAEVRRAKARLDRVKDQIEKCRIVSPVDGRVVRRHTEIGAWLNPGSPVIEIVTLDPVLVRIGVGEKNIAKIAVGNPVIVRVDAHPGRVFTGKVRFVAPEAAPRTRAFPVQVEVANADGALLAGMFARVSIGCGEGHEALTVHKDAVVNTPTGPAVWTLGPKKEFTLGPRKVKLPTAKMIPVTLGIAVDDRVEVTGEGLAPKLPLVTTGNEQLFPGRGLVPPRPPTRKGVKKPAENEGGAPAK